MNETQKLQPGECMSCGKATPGDWLKPYCAECEEYNRRGAAAVYTGQGGAVRHGWVCPKCGGVYSPDTSACWHCAPPITFTCGAQT